MARALEDERRRRVYTERLRARGGASQLPERPLIGSVRPRPRRIEAGSRGRAIEQLLRGPAAVLRALIPVEQVEERPGTTARRRRRRRNQARRAGRVGADER